MITKLIRQAYQCIVMLYPVIWLFLLLSTWSLYNTLQKYEGYMETYSNNELMYELTLNEAISMIQMLQESCTIDIPGGNA